MTTDGDHATPDGPSRELARRDAPALTQRARADWDPAQIELIQATVAKGCTRAELGMLLELAARYELDPFAHQIWAAKMGGDSGPATIFAGRDGFLTIADRREDFEGLVGDYVHEHDLFEKSVTPDGVTQVNHQPQDEEGKPTGHDAKRGDVVGAWALVFRRGRRPTYFFAKLSEYKPPSPHQKSPWAKQPSAMILKCAEATALRKAFTITGLVGAEEVDMPAPGSDRQASSLTAAPAPLDYGDDEYTAAKLEQLFDLLDYAPRKRVLKLAGPLGTGCTHDDRVELLKALLAEARERNVEVPPLESIEEPPEVIDAEPVAEPSAA